jgi:hypothetical protein
VIRGCPKLATLPDTPNLKVVELGEDKAQLSLLIVGYRYISLLSELRLSVCDKESALELDCENNIESPLLNLRLYGCNFFLLSSPSLPTVGIWRCFGKLVSLEIYCCHALIYWPDALGNLFLWKFIVVMHSSTGLRMCSNAWYP